MSKTEKETIISNLRAECIKLECEIMALHDLAAIHISNDHQSQIGLMLGVASGKRDRIAIEINRLNS